MPNIVFWLAGLSYIDDLGLIARVVPLAVMRVGQKSEYPVWQTCVWDDCAGLRRRAGKQCNIWPCFPLFGILTDLRTQYLAYVSPAFVVLLFIPRHKTLVYFNFLTVDKLLSHEQGKLCSTFGGHGYGVYDIFPEESFIRCHQ